MECYICFRFWHVCSHRHVTFFCQISSNQTIGCGVLTSYRFFKKAVVESEIYYRVQFFCDCIRLRWWKSISMPNFDEISESTAEIKLLPVSEKGRSPYWNFTSDFDFDHMLSSVWFSFIVIRPSVAGVMTSYHFLKIAAMESASTSGFIFSVGTRHLFMKMDIYLHTRFRWDISMLGWDNTTSFFWKQKAAILQLYFRLLACHFASTCQVS